MASNIGLTNFAAVLLLASHIPIGSPISKQKNTEVSTKAKVVIACDHAPIKPMKMREIAVDIPNLKLENCHASKNRISTMIGAGVDTNVVSNDVRIKSMGTRTA